MTDERDSRLRHAIRAVVRDALDAGMLGRAIIRQLESETARLREALPPRLTPRDVAEITARVAGRYGEEI